MVEPVLPRPGLVVDEADEVEAVFGVPQHLAGHALAHVPGADDDRVLQVRDAAPAPEAGDRARDGDERDREPPQRHRLREVRSGGAEQPFADEEEPDADGDQVEDAAELVRGRMVRPLLVLLVEAVEARDQDPAGNRRQEHRVFEPRPEVMVRARAGAESELDEGEGRGERDHVCEDEHAAHQPASAAHFAGRTALLEDLECPLVREHGPLRGADRRQRVRGLQAHFGHAVRTTSRCSPCAPPDLRRLLSVGAGNRFFKARVESPTGDGVAGRSEGDRDLVPRNQAPDRPSRIGEARDADADEKSAQSAVFGEGIVPPTRYRLLGMEESPAPPI